MTGWMEDNALRFEGLDDQDIADINAMLPDFQAIEPELQHVVITAQTLAAAQTNWGHIQRIVPIVLKWAPVILRIGNKIAAKQRSLP